MRSLTKAEIINTNGGRDDKGGNFHTSTTTKKEKKPQYRVYNGPAITVDLP
ncbi:hypothetical protein [Fusibacter sp. JL216-2]|uniref:hypothetical protein n=1 Tax=Fusibacter sp. JL216-2 TaxID=3071453 RepID=UPI003D35611A